MELLDRERLSHQLSIEVYGFMLQKIHEAVDSEPEVRLLMLQVIERILQGAITSLRVDVMAKSISGD